MEKRIGVRLPISDHNRLTQLSAQSGLTTSEVIRTLLASAEVVEVKTMTVKVKPATVQPLPSETVTGSAKQDR